MEPENLVIEQLKAIREAIEANGERIEANGQRIDANTNELRELRTDVQANSARLSAVEEAILGYTAQITMFSRSLTVQMEARTRLEDKIDAMDKRLADLEDRSG